MKLSGPTGRWLVAAALVSQAALGGDKKGPGLRLRVVPQWGPPSTEFLLVADLKGGVDSEELYCPTAEWQWGPQDTSVEDAECPPFEAGVTPVVRRFSTHHTFKEGGPRTRTVTLVLRKGEKVLARASTQVLVSWEKTPPAATFRSPDSR
jgi:hypothetical protein